MWQEILAAVLPPLAAALMAGVPALLKWLKSQEWVQKLHLESMLSVIIPQVIEWVEWWAQNIFPEKFGRDPSSDEKLAKAVQMVQAKMPPWALVDLEELRLRIESALSKKEAR